MGGITRTGPVGVGMGVMRQAKSEALDRVRKRIKVFRWNRNLRPQPQKFSKLVFLIYFG